MGQTIEEKYSNPKIGFSDEIRFFIVSNLQSQFNFQTLLISQMIASIRMNKSQTEIDLLRCANIATKKAIKIASRSVYSGFNLIISAFIRSFSAFSSKKKVLLKNSLEDMWTICWLSYLCRTLGVLFCLEALLLFPMEPNKQTN